MLRPYRTSSSMNEGRRSPPFLPKLGDIALTDTSPTESVGDVSLARAL